MKVKYLHSIKPENAVPSTFGGKAANLSKMIHMGLPVPPGLVATTDWTEYIGKAEDEYSINLLDLKLRAAIRGIANPDNGFWNSDDRDAKPLIVSVRSGAPISMPGMMDTILNIGLTEKNLEGFAKINDNRKFALDCYRRLIQMYGETVHGIPDKEFSDLWNSFSTFYYDGLTESTLEDIIARYLDIYKSYVSSDFPDDPDVQLLEAAKAVYRSWYSEKAKSYRDIENIDETLGTAVTVQKMVFGNLDNSATGVVFTHNPNTGSLGLYGDFLEGAQGEDVVSGAFKVSSIDAMLTGKYKLLGRELQGYLRDLYNVERDILDVEFTIENNKLWILQYRKAKRSTRASIRFIIDLAKKGEINSIEATTKFMELVKKSNISTPNTIENADDLEFVGKGLGVTSGIAVGKAALTKEFVEECIKNNEPYIFIANETSPSDTSKMKDAQGILTAQGGAISHAAIVARGWDKPCVVSASGLKISEDEFVMAGVKYEQGSIVKIDGESGSVWM